MTATALRMDLYNTIKHVNKNHTPVHITTSRGKGAVLIGEDDWASINETVYLQSIPSMTKSIIVAREEPCEDALQLEDVDR